jgi:opacity protein-like surface antigen
MIKKVIFSLVTAATLAIPAFAGTQDKSISQPTAIVDYGVGPYVALQGGFNAWQDTYNDGFLSRERSLGGFGGLKAGYVFHIAGLVRPAVEFDGFYNGFSQDQNIAGLGKVGRENYETGACMVNGLARFNLAAFQPYAGIGVGGYTAGKCFTDTYGNSANYRDSGFAWQIVAGADYYVTPAISIFMEGKFLTYHNIAYLSDFRQVLAGGGVRFHF